MTEEETAKIFEKKGKTRFVLLVLLLILLVFAALIWRVCSAHEKPGYEANVTVGSMPGKSLEAIEAELQGKVDEKTISYTVNGRPVFESGGAMGNLKLDCPENNVNDLQFVITRNDTGEQLYDSGVLQPGSYIEEDYLQRKDPLPAGVYECTVVITATAPDSGTVRGNVNVNIILTVKN